MRGSVDNRPMPGTAEPIETSRELLTLPQAARRIGVPETTLRVAIRAGDVLAFRLGPRGRWRLHRETVDEIVERTSIAALSGRENGGSP
jgi:excisionase family DNA binding protein